ncbi:hypothetical protein BH10PLA2_BH10PLA2_33710 [soil metagenome]
MGLFNFGWLPRLLFKITMALALLLGTIVLVAPMVVGLNSARGVRVIHLFARDGVLRKTALASACGLAINACVFFRSPRTPRKASDSPISEAPAEITGP